VNPGFFALALVTLLGVAAPPRPAPAPRPQALVTTETENRLAVVDLPSGRIARQITLPADPEFVAADRHVVVVVSPAAGAVSVLDRSSLHPIGILRGFGSPHIAELSPDGRYAYVTDDARGELAVIRLRDAHLVARIPVGAGAHHLGVRPDGGQLWIALGESARTIVIVETSDPARPRVIGQFDPGFAAHDLLFAPGGRRVWITPASSSDVGVFSTQTHRMLFGVPAGAPPQHVAFAGERAYLTSGYGSQIEMARIGSGRVLKVVHAAYGSFNLDVSAGFVAVASLLRGTLSVYDDRLRLLHVERVAPAARDVTISPLPRGVTHLSAGEVP
jgi:DNA-binding beta-propeller fold protein YncE